MNRFGILLLGGLVVLLGQPSAVVAEITTTVGVQSLYDDNIYKLEKNDVDSWITVVRPGAQLVIDQGASSYTLEGGAESGIYSQSKLGDDDYTDYHVGGKAKLQFDERDLLELDLTHTYGHDARGSGRTDVVGKSFTPVSIAALDIAEPDQYQQEYLGAQYTYGSDTSYGRVVLGGRYGDMDYQNHSPLTDRGDYQVMEFRTTGYLRLLSRTSFLLEARQRQVDYHTLAVAPPVVANSSRDSTQTSYFVGAEWKATAKTEGSVRLGHQTKDPDAPAFNNFSSTVWEADVVWRPRSYSALRFNAHRGAQQGANAIAYLIDEFYSINWRHDWSESVSTELYVQRDKQAHTDIEDVTDRTDRIETFGIMADYALTDWLKLSTTYAYEDRSSSIVGLDYERNIFMVGADATFR